MSYNISQEEFVALTLHKEEQGQTVEQHPFVAIGGATLTGQQNQATPHTLSDHFAEGTKRMQYADNSPEQRIHDALADKKRQSADSCQVSCSHYKDMPIQPWAVMESVLTREEFLGFLRGNVIKYSMRAGRKEGSDDAGKAKHYMEKLLKMEQR